MHIQFELLHTWSVKRDIDLAEVDVFQKVALADHRMLQRVAQVVELPKL